ncbi:hypothetical protein [Neisseria animaloris]|uniref:hypothetical protein n=1 Tax=Neisseria animaloris TaxID=326522 RepID=UPI000F828A0E|nr:hypothetical protein [Neisseria animaloris]
MPANVKVNREEIYEKSDSLYLFLSQERKINTIIIDYGSKEIVLIVIIKITSNNFTHKENLKIIPTWMTVDFYHHRINRKNILPIHKITPINFLRFVLP